MLPFMDGKFGRKIHCMADGQEKTFDDGYALDAHYLGHFRPQALSIYFLVRLRLFGEVIADASAPSGESVVVQTQYGEKRFPRSFGNHQGMGVQWKRDAPQHERLQNFILELTDVDDGLTDRKCIWIPPGDIVTAYFRVLPNAFGPNDSIADIVTLAKICITRQLLDLVQPA